MTRFLTSTSTLTEPISRDDAKAFINRIVDASSWGEDEVSVVGDFGEVTGSRKYTIIFRNPSGSLRNDVTATVEFVPDLMMSALTLTVEYVEKDSGDEYIKTFGASSYDQLGFLAALQHQLDTRRNDAGALDRQDLQRSIADMTSTLRAAKRIEHLLIMRRLYSQLRELGEVGNVFLEPQDRGNYIVSARQSQTNQIKRNFTYERIINTVKPPLEAVIAAGAEYDGTRYTLDLFTSPGGVPEEQLMDQLHQLLLEF